MHKGAEMCGCSEIHGDAVSKATREMESDVDLSAASDIFRVLGDPTRMKIMWALMQTELCVCDLAAALGMTKSAISHQLGTLKAANMVKARRDGKNVFYSLDDQHVADIVRLGMIHAKHK